MNTELFNKNCTALKQKDIGLARRIEECRYDDTWEVIASKRGPLTLKKKQSDGSNILLHSVYDPEKEAASLVDTYTYTPTHDLVFLGFGFAYHIREVLRRGGKRGFILIVEKDLYIIRKAFESIDCTDIISHPQVIWSVDEPIPRLFNRLKEHSLSILANGCALLEHPPSVKLYHTEYMG